MKTNASFVIRPKRELQEKLLALNVRARDLLLIPTLWTKALGGCHSTESLEDATLIVKLLFLAKLTNAYLDETEKQQLFQSENLNVTTFDRWWTIEAFEYADEIAEEVQNELPDDMLSLLASTGNPHVDDWLKMAKQS